MIFLNNKETRRVINAEDLTKGKAPSCAKAGQGKQCLLINFLANNKRTDIVVINKER